MLLCYVIVYTPVENKSMAQIFQCSIVLPTCRTQISLARPSAILARRVRCSPLKGIFFFFFFFLSTSRDIDTDHVPLVMRNHHIYFRSKVNFGDFFIFVYLRDCYPRIDGGMEV